MAIEDGAVLGALFSKLTDPSQIPAVLKTYEELRKPRTTRVVQGSLDQGKMCKLPNGKKQKERDEWMAAPTLDDYPMHIATQKFSDFLFGYDAMKKQYQFYLKLEILDIHKKRWP